MRNKNTGTYWFNLKSNFESIECNPGTDPTNTKKIKIDSDIGVLMFKDPTSGIQYELVGVGQPTRDCEMTLAYESLTVHVTLNGSCIEIRDLQGRHLVDFIIDKSIFNSYQSFVLNEIARDLGSNKKNTCLEDAILIHKFLESV